MNLNDEQKALSELSTGLTSAVMQFVATRPDLKNRATAIAVQALIISLTEVAASVVLENNNFIAKQPEIDKAIATLKSEVEREFGISVEHVLDLIEDSQQKSTAVH